VNRDGAADGREEGERKIRNLGRGRSNESDHITYAQQAGTPPSQGKGKQVKVSKNLQAAEQGERLGRGERIEQTT